MSKADTIRRKGMQDRFLEYVAKHPKATDVEIGAALGASPEYVRKAASRTRKVLAKVSKTKPIRLNLPGRLVAMLEPHADLRSTSVEKFAALLIETACRENLVDAVMDDHEAKAPA